MISGLEQGGQLMITTDVENYPGFEKPIQGPWLMEQMKNQAESFGTRILVDFVKDVNLETLPFKIKTERQVIKSNSISGKTSCLIFLMPITPIKIIIIINKFEATLCSAIQLIITFS